MFKGKRARIISLYQKYGTEGIWVVVGHLLNVLLGLLSLKIFSNLLSQEEYGKLALGLTIASFFQLMVFSSIEQGSIRFFASLKEHGVSWWYIAKRYIQYAIAFLILVVLAYVLLSHYLIELRSYQIIYAAVLFCVASGCYSIYQSILTSVRDRKSVAVSVILFQSFKFLLALVLLLSVSATGQMVLYGYAIGGSLGVLFLYIYLRNSDLFDGLVRSDPEMRDKFFRYSIPFLGWAPIAWVTSFADRWIINGFATTADVGNYIIAWQLGTMPSQLILALVSTFITPYIFKNINVDKNERVMNVKGKINLYYFVFSLACLILLYLLQDFVFQLLVDEKYWPYAYLLPFSFMAASLFNFGQLLTLDVLAQNNTRGVFVAKVISAVTVLLFGGYGMYLWGLLGLILGNSLSNAILVAYIFYLKRQ